MIKLQIIGSLGKDAVVNEVNGKSVINFSVAHSETYKDQQGNKQTKTTWVDCAQWVNSTGIVPYLKKGTLVYVEGSPEARAYAKGDGTPGSSLSVRVSNIQLLGSSNRNGGNSNSEEATTASKPAAPVNDPSNEIAADLPF